MLILNQQEIEQVCSPLELIAAMEKAFHLHHSKAFSMPNRMHTQHKDLTLLLMPCFTENFFGTKLVSVNPKNPAKGKAAIYGNMILNDGDSGEGLALLNGAALTALRTGAVGAVAVKYLAPESCTHLGIIGTGKQGFTQAIMASSVRPIQQISVFDIDSKRQLDFVNRLQKKLPEIKIIASENTEDLLIQSEIVITSTTSKKPVLPNQAELLKGKVFIGIGSYQPDMREFPDALFPLLKNVWVDTDFASIESGDLAIPLEKQLLQKEQINPISQLLAANKTAHSETSFFKSVGMALFDVVAAEFIYKKALQQNIGTNITL